MTKTFVRSSSFLSISGDLINRPLPGVNFPILIGEESTTYFILNFFLKEESVAKDWCPAPQTTTGVSSLLKNNNKSFNNFFCLAEKFLKEISDGNLTSALST